MTHKHLHKTAASQKAGIRRTLFAYLAVFCAAVLLLIWIVQVFLLDRIYYGILLHRMETASEALSTVALAENPQIGADAVALHYEVAIAVFSVENGNLAAPLVRADGSAGAVLGKMQNMEYAELYAQAKQNGGTATKEMKVEYAFYHGPGDSQTVVFTRRLVYVRLLSGTGGRSLAVFLDAPIIPQGAQTSAVMVEIILLSVLLILSAALLARKMSTRIAAPIATLTDGAKRLAGGHYDTQFHAHGYREIEDLSATLNYAATELSRVDTLQKEWIANVSHDLRTPLTTIIGYAEMMRDIEGENKPENMQVIIDEATRLASLVNDLLDISRYDPNAPPVREDLDIGALVKNTVARYAQMLAAEGYVFHIKVAPGQHNAAADVTMIQQVLCNLLQNAVNYTGEYKDITVTCQTVGTGHVRVEVLDKGPGIAPEELPHIWDRYYRAGTPHRRSVVGSGLGLSIVRGILEAHHARYGVDSRQGEGSRFWFELPPDTFH